MSIKLNPEYQVIVAAKAALHDFKRKLEFKDEEFNQKIGLQHVIKFVEPLKEHLSEHAYPNYDKTIRDVTERCDNYLSGEYEATIKQLLTVVLLKANLANNVVMGNISAFNGTVRSLEKSGKVLKEDAEKFNKFAAGIRNIFKDYESEFDDMREHYAKRKNEVIDQYLRQIKDNPGKRVTQSEIVSVFRIGNTIGEHVKGWAEGRSFGDMFEGLRGWDSKREFNHMTGIKDLMDKYFYDWLTVNDGLLDRIEVEVPADAEPETRIDDDGLQLIIYMLYSIHVQNYPRLDGAICEVIDSLHRWTVQELYQICDGDLGEMQMVLEGDRAVSDLAVVCSRLLDDMDPAFRYYRKYVGADHKAFKGFYSAYVKSLPNDFRDLYWGFDVARVVRSSDLTS